MLIRSYPCSHRGLQDGPTCAPVITIHLSPSVQGPGLGRQTPGALYFSHSLFRTASISCPDVQTVNIGSSAAGNSRNAHIVGGDFSLQTGGRIAGVLRALVNTVPTTGPPYDSKHEKGQRSKMGWGTCRQPLSPKDQPRSTGCIFFCFPAMLQFKNKNKKYSKSIGWSLYNAVERSYCPLSSLSLPPSENQ